MRRMPPPIAVMPPEYRGDLSQAWINLADQPLKDAFAAVRDFRIPWFNPWRLWRGPHPSPTKTPARRDFWAGLVLTLIGHFLGIFTLLGVTRVVGLSWTVSWIITGAVLLLCWYCLYFFWLGADWLEQRRQLQDRLKRVLQEVDTDRASNLRDGLYREIRRLDAFAAQRGPAANKETTGSLADLRVRLWDFTQIEGMNTHPEKIHALLRRVDGAIAETTEDYRSLRASASALGSLAHAWQTERSLDLRHVLEQKLNEGVMTILERVRSRENVNEALLTEGYALIGTCAIEFRSHSASVVPNKPTITN